jgi:transcriptional regulator with XRE-family HTH domain
MSKDEERYLNGVAKNIARIRKQKGITQEQLAELTGMDAVSIGYIEQGKRRPTLRTIYRLATSLHIPPDSLLK